MDLTWKIPCTLVPGALISYDFNGNAEKDQAWKLTDDHVSAPSDPGRLSGYSTGNAQCLEYLSISMNYFWDEKNE
jgi:hypothetical protein